MNIIKAKTKYINANNMTPYELVEKAGRTCYKSENNITPDSAEKFVKRMIKNRHTAMLEHAHIYIKCENYVSHALREIVIYDWLKYINISNECISASFRAFLELFENYTKNEAHPMVPTVVIALKEFLTEKYPAIFKNVKFDMEYSYPVTHDRKAIKDGMQFVTRDELKTFLSDKDIMKHLTHTVVFTCDRGVTHEIVRHRPSSYAQESTRYCNYAHDKFGKEITVIEPLFFEPDSAKYKSWEDGCRYCEQTYFDLLDLGATPQEARDILPQSVKSEIVVTTTENEWLHILNLRYKGTTGKPHPQMVEIMNMIYPTLCKESENRLNVD